jgi:membrane protein DedA with SNARE-associated domain
LREHSLVTLAALVDVPATLGYPLLFVLVGAESAGALVPGETALIVAGALAGDGKLSLPLVIVTAAAAAILGDNIGYQIGRRGLRRLLDRPGRSQTRRQRAIARGDAFFQRYGPAAVFFGRWLPGLRVFAAWLAGANRMPWHRFLFWNALGGIGWAATIGSLAYLLGRSASGSLGAIGLAGIAIAVVVFVVHRVRVHVRDGRQPAQASMQAPDGRRS